MKKHKKRILTKECEDCRNDRASRALVALTSDDVRLTQPPFTEATAVFANNDVKYDVNKKRAQDFANTCSEAVTYIAAKDTPSPEALRERPDLPAHKLSWLQRHDRESGDLYGVLQLVKDMPVALTDHIDRSTDKQLLRGRIGFVHSWVLDDKETSVFQDGKRVLKHLPKVIFVKFFLG